MRAGSLTALCWASSNGTVLTSGKSQNDYDGQLFVYGGDKIGFEEVLTLSSSRMKNLRCVGRGELALSGYFTDMRCTRNNHGADLLILTLEWSTGMKNLRCVGRGELALSGYFTDMRCTRNNHGADLLVLTSPGHLQLFSNDSLFSLTSKHDKRISLSSLECPVVVPTLDLVLSASKLISLLGSENA
nr:hypothetical protein [Tanacetum cinerariifolium]